MDSVLLRAPAKLNLALDVVGTDERGYHLMQMVMQTIDLFDTVKLTISEASGIKITCDRAGIPTDEHNICYKCVAAFFKFIDVPKEHQNIIIDIKKLIPQQAGMAGGSADGAAVLVGLNRLYNSGLSTETLCKIGEKIGADIPFCIVGATALVEGFGERITKIANFPDCSIVVAKPNGGVNTQKAFAQLDSMGIKPQLDIENMISAVKAQDILSVCTLLYNAFEQVCQVEDVKHIKDIMTGSGARGALMTGSGSAVFGIFTDRKKAYNCERKLAVKYTDTFLCRPTSSGVEILPKTLPENG